MANNFEQLRSFKIDITFTGAAFKGLNGSPLALSVGIPPLENNEFIYDVFYRVTDTLTSGVPASTYLTFGVEVDDAEAIMDSTQGVVDTLNATPAQKLTPNYNKTTNQREVVGTVGGSDDITGGSIEVIVTVARVDEVFDDVASEGEYLNGMDVETS